MTPCARCGRSLVGTGGPGVLECPEHGVFLTAAASERRLAMDVTEALRGAAFSAQGLRCPACGSTMSAIRAHGVEVDGCPSCGGSWVDKDELARVSDLAEDLPPPGWQGRVITDLMDQWGR